MKVSYVDKLNHKHFSDCWISPLIFSKGQIVSESFLCLNNQFNDVCKINRGKLILFDYKITCIYFRFDIEFDNLFFNERSDIIEEMFFF